MKVVLIILLIAGGVYLFFEYGLPYISGPKFEDVSIDSVRLRQREAQELLRRAQIAQRSYFTKHGKYARRLDELDVQTKGTYYTLRITEYKPNYFSIRAEGNVDNDPTIDVWIINPDGMPQNIVDDAMQ